MPRKPPTALGNPSVIDANHVVGSNLRRARKARGLTQEDLADALYPYLGRLINKSSISQMERAGSGDRRRVFTADEITAFALALDLPVSWFFIPSADVCAAEASLVPAELPVERLLALLVGREDQQQLMLNRIAEVTAVSPQEAGRAAELSSPAIAEQGWASWSSIRSSWIEACVATNRIELDEMFAKMESLVETYATMSIAKRVIEPAQ